MKFICYVVCSGGSPNDGADTVRRQPFSEVVWIVWRKADELPVRSGYDKDVHNDYIGRQLMC